MVDGVKPEINPRNVEILINICHLSSIAINHEKSSWKGENGNIYKKCLIFDRLWHGATVICTVASQQEQEDLGFWFSCP